MYCLGGNLLFGFAIYRFCALIYFPLYMMINIGHGKVWGHLSHPKRGGSCWGTWKQSNETSFTADTEFCYPICRRKYETWIAFSFQSIFFSCFWKMIGFQVEIEVKLFLTGTPDLSNEAAGIFIWCLTQSADCYKHWVSYSHQTLYADTRWFLHFPLWPAM